MPGFAAQQASDTRDQNGEVERLRQIIIRARFKSLQDVLRTRAGRQHEYGNIVVRRAQSTSYGEPVFSRQHYIQDERAKVRSLLRQQLQRLFASAADAHGISFRLEIETKAFGQMRFIFDDKDSRHTWSTLGRRNVNVLPW